MTETYILILVFIILVLVFLLLFAFICYVDGMQKSVGGAVGQVKDYFNSNLRIVPKTNYMIYYDQNPIPTNLPESNDFNTPWGVLLCRVMMSSYIYADKIINGKPVSRRDLQLPEELEFISGVGSRAILLQVKGTKTYILGNRGTVTRQDLIDDFNAPQEVFVNLDGNEMREDGDGDFALVHEGFYDNWIKLSDDYNNVYNSLPEGAELAIVGHSQGCGHAIFTAVSYQQKGSDNMNIQGKEHSFTISPRDYTNVINNKDISSPFASFNSPKLGKNKLSKIMTYLMAPPRYGNKVFSDYIQEYLPNTWLLINESDIVPTVPPAAYYFDSNTYLYDIHSKQVLFNIQTGSLGFNHYLNTYLYAIYNEAKEAPIKYVQYGTNAVTVDFKAINSN